MQTLSDYKLRIADYALRIRKQSGFTMLELMVTVGIFSLMTGLVLANFRSGARHDALRFGAEEIRGALTQARHRTLTGQMTTITDGTITATKFPPGGYGIAIEKSSQEDQYVYRTVAIDAFPGTEAYDDGSAVRTIGNEQQLASPLLVTLASNSGESLGMITFEPPQGTMVFRMQNGRIIDRDTFRTGQRMTIEHTAIPGEKKTITLDRVGGRISIE